MTAETWTTDQVAEHMGITVKSADKQLRRWGIAPIGRQPGRGGLNLYDANQVATAVARRPGRGRRSDLAERCR